MRSAIAAAAGALAALAAAAAPAAAAPVLGTELPRGTGTYVADTPRAPQPKAIDGDPSDWAGTASRYAGITVRSAGELIYTDHLFDAYGADDGGDAERLQTLDPLYSNLPEAYRLDAILQNDPAGQVGIPAPDQLRAELHYGDLPQQDRADLTELRLAPDGDGLAVLARTATMTDAGDLALLLLLDTGEGGERREVGFGSGLHTDRAEYAVMLTAAGARIADLRTGEIGDGGAVAAKPDGWTNALEARIALPARPVAVAAVAGRPQADGGIEAPANAAFRTAEPVREFFEKQQALSLLAGTVDPFFQPIDLAALAAGASERHVPGAGYHERIFRSTEAVARESGADGILQHYGVFLPSSYDGTTPKPLQLWLHWRGGSAHSAANVTPRIFEDLGEERQAIVISPRGRGSSSWYVGRGQVDIEDVWSDAHAAFAIDARRRYVAGHSMGGWGSYLLTITHPDRFAASAPASAPVTQGAWTGIDAPGCDGLAFQEYTPCYISANGGDPRAQHTRRLLENLRHVPLAIYHGAADELVPVSGVTRQVERLVQLGYRHRYYLFPEQEHFGPPVWDEWGEAARYEHSFRAPENPARVTYRRDMRFERATETVNSGGAALDFSFDSAYWMSGLEPVDAETGVASFDGRSRAIAEADPLVAAEAGGPAALDQTGPWVMTGIQWLSNPLASAPPAVNAFDATLSGARAVRLDTGRMALRTDKTMSATVRSDAPVALTLTGPWRGRPIATVNGLIRAIGFEDGRVTLSLPAGTSAVALQPRQ